jgi:hypothetical protein
MRTSARRGRSSPTRWSSPSCTARRSLGWSSSGISPTLPFVPLTFRWSRVLWLHFDSLFDPALRAPQGLSSSTDSVARFSPSMSPPKT